MKSNKAHLVLILAIGVVTFVFSQWIIKSNKADALFDLSSDALAGLVIRIGIGAMVVLLRQGIARNKAHCN